MKHPWGHGLIVSVALVLGTAAAPALAQTYQTVDLTPYVNEGFTNSWFINGGDFTSYAGVTSMGNQGSAVPFAIANDANANNFWFGLYSGPGTLFGSPGSFTIPISATGVTHVYTLADNTFGTAGSTEYSVTFTGSGGSFTGDYVGGTNTRDYNLNCSTTGCLALAVPEWVDNGRGQWLHVVDWAMPANFGLSSITFNQVDGTDGAIVAGVTLGVASVPEPATWAMVILGFGAIGWTLRRPRIAVRYI
jgi:hypothetical protein